MLKMSTYDTKIPGLLSVSWQSVTESCNNNICNLDNNNNNNYYYYYYYYYSKYELSTKESSKKSVAK